MAVMFLSKSWLPVSTSVVDHGSHDRWNQILGPIVLRIAICDGVPLWGGTGPFYSGPVPFRGFGNWAGPHTCYIYIEHFQTFLVSTVKTVYLKCKTFSVGEKVSTMDILTYKVPPDTLKPLVYWRDKCIILCTLRWPNFDIFRIIYCWNP